MRKVLIAPSILSADFSNLAGEIREIETAGADWIHVDVMDGHFVPNLTIGPVVVDSIRGATVLPLDVHLMITDPEKYAPAFAEAGADSLTFHCEAAADPVKTLRFFRSLKKGVGVSLRPRTPVEKVLPLLPELDLVLVMTVEPGFGGQKFMPDMLPKVAAVRKEALAKGLKIRIEVDGGINPETAALAVREGADVLVAGNSIFGDRDRKRSLAAIRNSIDKIT
ncbi:MAG: ribulose-phosphate 3-epimerase [Elusimicrobia bacterium RIFCSPLOWO2_01_FULL_64_13]|nr:MAG: ribulose-phosphate 3-epimerase [Elusimicrobia bacterium RIFCSPHIGHO2_01_FULL_64_10]OGR95349.1 MAG: ribulose-phosphate 3-epimerase [Elusimicrobia bacterium RIFCSPLOWO2_01_FULL_64_13]